MSGRQSWSLRGGEEKNSQPLPGLELPNIQTVAQGCTTEFQTEVMKQYFMSDTNFWKTTVMKKIYNVGYEFRVKLYLTDMTQWQNRLTSYV
jgi:hypothetical protein